MQKDVIYRRAAIDALAEELYHNEEDYRTAVKVIGGLPSAQPEIIHCKDCKHSEHWYRDRRRCFLWSEDGVSVFDDGFCSYAERKSE